MARTRAQSKGSSNATSAPAADVGAKRKRATCKEESEQDDGTVDEGSYHTPKSGKQAHDEGSHPAEQKSTGENSSNERVRELLDKYGSLPLKDSGLTEPEQPTAATMLAHLLNAELSSTRISHALAAKTVRTVVEAGYADLDALERSSWTERTDVLTQGGYTHYREKTATQLGEVATLIRTEYGGDLNNLLKKAKENAGSGASVTEEVRRQLKQIKGLGDVAVDVFCDTAQGLWPELAPFLDPRSDKTAEALGLPTDVDGLYALVGKEPKDMCRLASALTTVRLEKKEDEFIS